MRGRYNLTLAAFIILLAVAVAAAVFIATATAHQAAVRAEFLPAPKDRPVLETVEQVWQARSGGVGAFHFDGTYYVISEIPKEYVDYSSWCVRMP